MLDKCCLITIVKLHQLRNPLDLPEITANTTMFAGRSSDTSIIDKKRDNIKLKIEKYKLQIANEDKKHTTLGEITSFNCQLGLTIQVKNVHVTITFWYILKETMF